MRAASIHEARAIGNPGEKPAIPPEELDPESATIGTMAGISRALGTGIGSRFLRIAALGALLVGAASLYLSISQGEADSQTPVIRAARVSQAVINLTPAEHEAAELPYDELTRNFFGISSPASAAAGLVESAPDPDPAELLYDEISRDFFGVSSPTSAAAGLVESAPDPDPAADPAEVYYDDLTRNFFGVGSPASARPGFVASVRDPDLAADLAELPYDELTRNFFGVPFTSK